MCGVVGIVSTQPVNQALYNALTVMQHRGQDAAGIVTWSKKYGLKQRKSNGLVRDVFRHRHMMRLKGNVGIAHVRYPTAGGSRSSEAQPFYVNSPYGICLAHNGNLTNYDELADLLIREDRRHLSTNSDSEVLLNVFAHELQNRVDGRPTAADIFGAIEAVHKRCTGGYAVVAMIIGFGIVAFRDPHGIRPLVLGERESDGKKEYIVASESVALDILQFTRLRDVRPGECIIIENSGQLHCQSFDGATRHTPCIFEYVYFARPDSILDDLSVYKARLRMGEQLAGKIVRDFPDHDIDVVIPIPDTSRTAALQVAYHLGVKYREGFIKNRYIGRTFIMPGQAERTQSVRRKLNAISLEFRNKNVLLVDDSIVRGTTSQQIIKLAREAGAKKVYFASAAPPVRYPNVYGIDMPAASELIANGRTIEEIQEIIGADRLIYQDLHGLIRSVRHGNSAIREFDTSCFSGEYVTGDVTEEYLHELESRRNDAAKQSRRTRNKRASNVVSL
ncbi:MAG: amidophosphoribosyltransferase [Gammaproteobacteria bacterium]|nr:amidophosphoribosyltransferase [Gammaproteobacteria bacterium]MDH3363118.1 amidophosphoribosyltransferase [Gammaproteobacteria bacterium]MDH3481910.1 amidophosphoribosyltransferase [Gammaproteobacteria bacterium]